MLTNPQAPSFSLIAQSLAVQVEPSEFCVLIFLAFISTFSHLSIVAENQMTEGQMC